jgi:hypothetical protein
MTIWTEKIDGARGHAETTRMALKRIAIEIETVNATVTVRDLPAGIETGRETEREVAERKRGRRMEREVAETKREIRRGIKREKRRGREETRKGKRNGREERKRERRNEREKRRRKKDQGGV